MRPKSRIFCLFTGIRMKTPCIQKWKDLYVSFKHIRAINRKKFHIENRSVDPSLMIAATLFSFWVHSYYFFTRYAKYEKLV